MDAFSLDPDGPLPDDFPTLQNLVRKLLRDMASLDVRWSKENPDNRLVGITSFSE
jgi:hypothetical protein